MSRLLVFPSIGQPKSSSFVQLHALVLKAASSSIVKQTSATQKKKVEGLVKAEKERKKSEKMKRSAVKQDRRGRGGWDF